MLRYTIGFICGACAGFGIAAFLTLHAANQEWSKPVPQPPGHVLRSIQLRIDDIDRKSKGRGDRYRVFDCREVAR